MKKNAIYSLLKHGFVFVTIMMFSTTTYGQPQMEDINRGLVAITKTTNQIYTSWRKLITDEDTLAFNVYRITDGADAVKVNPSPLNAGTNYLDASATTASANSYYITALKAGGEEIVSDTVSVWGSNYKTVPLQIPPQDTTPPYTVTNKDVTESYPDGQIYTYTANDCSVGDLDGDGEYEIVLKWDPANSRDNGYGGITGNTILDAYEYDGTHLWRIDLGINIRSGAHYTQFMVYDLDGDGKAEVACKTAPGTKDGSGNFLSAGPAASDDDAADYRSSIGYILTGPEYLTVFDGKTGYELITTNYIPARGDVASWGDTYGNRVDRFLACIAYLDGMKPSLVMCRGYYTGSGRGRTVLAAWNYRGDSLCNIWTFNADLIGENADYTAQGNHNLSVGDVDNDGKDEIIYGACSIDDDGTGLYTTGWGHGDAIHFGDLDPRRPGYEVFQPHEHYPIDAGFEYRNARTGDLIWGKPNTGDVGRGTAADIDPRYVGYEAWGAGGGLSNQLYSSDGIQIGSSTPPANFTIWWDGDLQREILDNIYVYDWNYTGGYTNTLLTASGCSSNNGTKSTPCLSADLFGDWREEVMLRKSDNTELIIYSTTTSTSYRINCLLQDHIYRMGIAWQNTGYNQPPQTGFYLGTEMYTHDSLIAPCMPSGISAKGFSNYIDIDWNANPDTDLVGYNVYRSISSGGPFSKVNPAVVTSLFYKDTSVIENTTYYYEITAVDNWDNESIESEVVSAAATIYPTVPTGLIVRNGVQKVKLLWDPHVDSEIVGYNIKRSNTSGSGFANVNPSPVTDTVYLDSALTDGQTYYYAVTAVNSDGFESAIEEVSRVSGPITYLQAEEGDAYNVLFQSNIAGFNGTAFANFLTTPGYVEFPYIYGNDGGAHILLFRYALNAPAKTGELIVNGEVESLTMKNTSDWTNYIYDSVNIDLDPEFTNTIRFASVANIDFGNLDEIIVKPGSFIPVNTYLTKVENPITITPNPFTSQTEISFKIDNDSEVSVVIYNYLGQEICRLFDGQCRQGIKHLTWNGKDANGKAISNGIYFCRVNIDKNDQWVGKIIYVK